MPKGRNLPFYGARLFPSTLLIPALPLPSGDRDWCHNDKI